MGEKIVIIEDTTDVRENIVEILELGGYEVHDAANGKEGVRMVQSVKPDLIICDIMMPELDGYGVLHLLNKDTELSAIPFVFLTAKAEKQDFRRGMNLGATDYLTKPFEAEDLLKTVEIRLQKKRINGKQYENSVIGLDQFINDAKAMHALDSLKSNREVKQYKKKDRIFKSEKKPFHLYYLIKGSVKLYNENEDGKEFITKVISENSFFGYNALILEADYENDAVALEDCEVAMIGAEDFKELLYRDPNVSRKFIKWLSNDVREKETALIKLAYNSVRKRVADSLVYLADKKNDENSSNKISILREDLASMVGTAKESAIRALCDIKEEGIIQIEQGWIEILDLDKLKSLNW